ncbi:unnamed protein product, partial [Adineta ricciae]
KRVLPPQFTEELDTISPLGARVHLTCPSRHASIYYTLDGKPPTQRTANVHRYDDDEGVILNENGLHVLRACAVEPQRISSLIVTSSPTFILDESERDELSKRLETQSSSDHVTPEDIPTSYKVILSSALKYPNKLYGMIEIDPADYMKHIDHFELYINDVAQKENITTRNTQFSAIGFAAGEQYEVYVVAHPKSNAPDGRSIASNKRTFEVQRETQDGAPLISLAISENQNVLTVMWAHIHGPVSEYNVYINDNKTQTITKKDFNDFYTVRFQDIEHGRKYLIYVEAKMENGKEIRKSNIIPITPPIKMTVKESTTDQFFPYIITEYEQTPDDVPLEKGSKRLSVPKLSVQKSPSSTSPPSTPEVSSSQGTHLTDMVNPVVSTSEIQPQKDGQITDRTEKNGNDQRKASTSDELLTKETSTSERKKCKQQPKEDLESSQTNDSYLRAKILLKRLTKTIDDRNKQHNSTYADSEAAPIDHQTLSPQTSSASDTYTTKLPPKPPRTPSAEPIQRRPESFRYAREPIPAAVGDAAPTVSYKLNPGGITLFWKKKSPSAHDSVENYRVVVDKKQYGELVSPLADPKVQVNLPPGKHECYLEIIPKNKKHEGYTSNILNVEVPPGSGLKHTTKQKSDPSDESMDKTVVEKELPIPKLNVSTISGTAIRANWYGDRPLPAGVFVAINEVHVCGPEFSENIKSDESSTDEDYIEHIWNVSNSPLEISGILDRHEYLVFVRTYYHIQGSKDTKYLITESNRVKTKRIDPLIELLTRPVLKVTKLGVQTASLSWKLDDTIDPSLVKGYRIILNSKPTEILSATQHEYELRNLKAGSTNEVQVSVTSHPDFVDEKISEPIRIVCPKHPHPPKIQSVIAEKPFSIRIQWEADSHESDDITAYRTFLNGKLHGEVENDGRQTFTFDFTKLEADDKYSIYVKSLLGQKRLEGNRYQCEIESNSSNELRLKCAVPPKGTVPRIERMHSNGVDIIWEAPEEYGDVKLTGYQILNNGRSIGKALPVDRRRASISDLEPGQRYSLQVVPITDQPGGVLFRKGEEYDADRHGHYLPSEKLEIDFTDIVQLPKQVWEEQIAGRSALICWLPIDPSTPTECQPDSYKLMVWNNSDLPRDKPRIVTLSKDQTSALLKDLQSDTKYEYQLEACKKRRHTKTKDSYNVLTTSEIGSFTTGSPPDPPMNVYIIACKNADVRIGFDPFVEHNAEIKALRILCEPASPETNAREIVQDFMPDSTEFIITNLAERTNYNATIYGITQEYLDDNRCRDVKQLPKKLKPSEWLPYKTFQFQTSGYEPASNINVTQANIEAIKLEWTLAKVYGSTECVQQVLRWQLEPGGKEQSLDLDRNTTKATIPGPLISGLYKIYLDTVLSVKINLEEGDDESDRKETRLTSNISASVRFHAPGTCEQPEIYLTGYTMNTIDLAWNKPGMFDVVDHPERTNEQLRIHRRLIGYRIDINDRKHNELDEDQRQCVLTDCHPNEEYKIRLVAQTIVQQVNMGNMITDEDKKGFEPDETPSKSLSVRTLKSEGFLRSFRANFEFYHDNSMSRSLVDPNNPSPLGKINVEWKIGRSKNISHFILQWRSSKDLRIQEKTLACNETSAIIDACDEKHFYVIDLIIVTDDGNRHQYEQLTVPIPGVPDAPKLWLVKINDTNFTVEWSEPKSYGIPIIGYELYIEGKRNGDMIEVKSHQIDIPSRINRTYQVNVCAITNHPQRSHSVMSQTLCVITTPTTDLVPTIYYNNDDGNALTLDQNIARIIPVQIDSINEERLHVDWTSFLHTPSIRAYYVHYTCLNNGEVQAMKISKRHRHAVLRGLRPGFTYGIMVMAVDKNGAVLYTSDKSTIQMNAPPNAPIVAILERTRTRVKLEWRAATSYGEFTVVGYKIFVNNRLAAILSHDQLTYTLTNGIPCDVYTVHVQALSSEKNVVSPMSRGVQFTWPGIRAGALRRVDDGQTGAVVVAWEHPQLEDETEKLLSFELFSKNLMTNIVQLHGKYDASTHQATISGLHNGKYTVWVEIQSEHYRVQSRAITVLSGRSLTLSNRSPMIESAKCFNKKQQRFRSPGPNALSNSFRHTQYS